MIVTVIRRNEHNETTSVSMLKVYTEQQLQHFAEKCGYYQRTSEFNQDYNLGQDITYIVYTNRYGSFYEGT